MSYHLLDPLARNSRFNILERRRRYKLIEFQLTPEVLRDKESDIWAKWGMKKAVKAPVDGTLAVKDLIMGGDAESSFGQVLGWNKKTSWIDRAQDVVDIIGIVDPTGIADAANALGYAARGKWGDAAVSALGIIPYAGDTAKIGKYGARAAKVAEVAGKAGKAEGRIAKAAKIFEKGAAKMAEKRAAKAAGKAAVHRAEKTAVRGAEKAAVRSAERAAVKPVSRLDKIKQVYQKAKPYIERGKEAQERIQVRRGAEGRAKQGNALTKVRGATDVAIEKGQGVVDKARTVITGRPLVPVDGDCPGKKTKTSTWGAPPGMKRCHKQTPGRDH